MNAFIISIVVDLILIVMLITNTVSTIAQIVAERKATVHTIKLHLKTLTLVIDFRVVKGKGEVLGVYTEKPVR